jgi:photosystem II stability/assembly factor-like uncharacterized protein
VQSGIGQEVYALLEDPQHAGHLIAGTPEGLWLSSDGGTSWRRGGQGLHGAGVLALAATAASPALYAGATDGAVYASPTDHGATWRRISPHFSATLIFSLAAEPPDGRVVLAGTTGAVYRGVRTGTGWTWQRVVSTGESAVSSIVWEAGKARTAYASVFAAQAPVLVTHDAGATWRPDIRGLPPILPTVALLPLPGRSPQVLLTTMGGGVYLRSDTGTWQEVDTGLPERHAMAAVAGAARGGVLFYAGTMGNGVYAKQGAAPWQRLAPGLDGAASTVLSLLLTAGPHPRLLAGTGSGLYRYAPPP